MNRDFKFRIWETKNKKWNDNLTITLNGELYDAYNDCFYSEGFEIMQSTGFTDKNGKEIYEHDVLKVTDRDNELYIAHSHYGDLFEVMWDEYDLRFHIVCINNSLIGHDLCIADSDKFEIIGTLHEQPELVSK